MLADRLSIEVPLNLQVVVCKVQREDQNARTLSEH